MRNISARWSGSRVGAGSGDTGCESLTGVADSLGIHSPVLGPNPEAPVQALVGDGGCVHSLGGPEVGLSSESVPVDQISVCQGVLSSL